jgi:hypothetical protein
MPRTLALPLSSIQNLSRRFHAPGEEKRIVFIIGPGDYLSGRGCLFLDATTYGASAMENHEFTIEVAQEFHRRMAAVIDAVQAGMWKAGLHNLLGYSTDFAFGQERGLQTLILKSRNRSAYVRLQWDAILGNTPADRAIVDGAIKSAIHELA